jgi:hypothetical protein
MNSAAKNQDPEKQPGNMRMINAYPSILTAESYCDIEASAKRRDILEMT